MSFGLFLLRLIVGTIFAAHGYTKLFGGPGKTLSPEAERYLGPGFAQSYQRGRPGFTEFLLSADMLVAIGKAHWRSGLFSPGGYELPLSLLGACLAMLAGGAGKISIDGIVSAIRCRDEY